MATASVSDLSVLTSDGVTLRYLTAGPASGPVLLLIHGWNQTAIQWKKQISHFSSKYRVIALDQRGHGDSDKPASGYRLSRLGADLHELITQLDLKNILLVGHSMGCSVIWSYWDTFEDSRRRVAKIVLVDQASVLTANPAWEEGVAQSLAAIFTPTLVFEFAANLAGPGSAEFTKQFIKGMFTPSISEEDLDWTMEQCYKMDGKHSATLLINHAAQDWRDVIPTINVPTLVIGGEASTLGKEGIKWVAAQIPGAQLKIFNKEEGGSHFMFWENPTGFNQVVEEFLQK